MSSRHPRKARTAERAIQTRRVNGHVQSRAARDVFHPHPSPSPADESSGLGRALSDGPCGPSRQTTRAMRKSFCSVSTDPRMPLPRLRSPRAPSRPSRTSCRIPRPEPRAVAVDPRSASPPLAGGARPVDRVRVERPSTGCPVPPEEDLRGEPPKRSPPEEDDEHPATTRSDTLVADTRPSEDGSSSASTRRPRPLPRLSHSSCVSEIGCLRPSTPHRPEPLRGTTPTAVGAAHAEATRAKVP